MTKALRAVIIGGVVESFVRRSLLYDFYGSMLTDRQREIYAAYVLEDYSFAEIADGLDISRQAVHDIIKRTESALSGYEEKLGLVERFENIRKELLKIGSCEDLDEAKKIAADVISLL